MVSGVFDDDSGEEDDDEEGIKGEFEMTGRAGAKAKLVSNLSIGGRRQALIHSLHFLSPVAGL
jgi:hypothetical protein